jgi:hypothetical protein
VLSSHQGNWAARTCSVFFNKRTYRRCHTSVRPLARRPEGRRRSKGKASLDHDERLEQRSPHKWTNGYKWKYRQT